ncbi:hypothetical protein N7470_006483 [Penicillium chermesinum]|nr:hypothetical protein N7470_006483 [Penicillium chermesinum]
MRRPVTTPVRSPISPYDRASTLRRHSTCFMKPFIELSFSYPGYPAGYGRSHPPRLAGAPHSVKSGTAQSTSTGLGRTSSSSTSWSHP